MPLAAHNLATLAREDLDMTRRNWGWFVALGLLLAAFGVVGLFLSGVFTAASVLLIGWLFVVGGAFEIGHAVVRRGWSGFWLDLLSGVLSVVVGVMIVNHPAAAAGFLTILIAVTFLVGGIFRLGLGVSTRNPYGGMLVLHGLIGILLGIMILAEWPFTALWVIGTLVAIDMLVNGIRLMALGLAARNLTPAEPAPPPGPAA
jgi:uncharacterized membrane protein HdeD (DUF308 family)